MSLNGRVAVVTGGARELGRAIAAACSNLCSKVAGSVTGQPLGVNDGRVIS